MLPGWPIPEAWLSFRMPRGWSIREDPHHVYLIRGEDIAAIFPASMPARAIADCFQAYVRLLSLRRAQLN